MRSRVEYKADALSESSSVALRAGVQGETPLVLTDQTLNPNGFEVRPAAVRSNQPDYAASQNPNRF